MNYLLDTNIVLAYVRQANIIHEIDRLYDPLNEERTPAISVVSVGEIKSIAIRNKWGNRKITLLETMLNKFVVADTNVRRIIERYAEIDAFSQGKLTNQTTPFPFTARNMGKNDLWIAATASILDIDLLTSDKDFEHLDGAYIRLAKV